MLAFVFWVTLPLAPAPVTVRLPTTRELVRAARLDDNELDRVAARLGAIRLLDVAGKGRRDERLAALKALPVVHDGWAALVPLAKLANDADGDIATAAATAARRIAEGMGPDTIDAEEIPGDVPADAARALLVEAARPSSTPGNRAVLLAAAAALRGVTRVDDGAIIKLLGDSEVDVRRAAAEALGGAATGEAPLAAALTSDASPAVAAAAAAVLCRDVPLSGDGAKPKSPSPPPAKTAKPKPSALAEARAGRLQPAARERLRVLAVDDTLALADRIDFLPCLRVNPTPDDQRVLDQLAHKGPESLKRRARSLGGH